MKKMNEQEIRQTTGGTGVGSKNEKGWTLTYRNGIADNCPGYKADVNVSPKFCWMCKNFVESDETIDTSGKDRQAGYCKAKLTATP